MEVSVRPTDMQAVVLSGTGKTLILSSQLGMFGPLDWNLMFPLTSKALDLTDQLLGGLSLLHQDGLALAIEPLLLTVVPPSFLGVLGLSRLLVLGHFELIVLVAPRTVGVAGLGDGNHHLASDTPIQNVSLGYVGVTLKWPRDMLA